MELAFCASTLHDMLDLLMVKWLKFFFQMMWNILIVIWFFFFGKLFKVLSLNMGIGNNWKAYI